MPFADKSQLQAQYNEIKEEQALLEAEIEQAIARAIEKANRRLEAMDGLFHQFISALNGGIMPDLDAIRNVEEAGVESDSEEQDVEEAGVESDSEEQVFELEIKPQLAKRIKHLWDADGQVKKAYLIAHINTPQNDSPGADGSSGMSIDSKIMYAVDLFWLWRNSGKSTSNDINDAAYEFLATWLVCDKRLEQEVRPGLYTHYGFRVYTDCIASYEEFLQFASYLSLQSEDIVFDRFAEDRFNAVIEPLSDKPWKVHSAELIHWMLNVDLRETTGFLRGLDVADHVRSDLPPAGGVGSSVSFDEGMMSQFLDLQKQCSWSLGVPPERVPAANNAEADVALHALPGLFAAVDLAGPADDGPGSAGDAAPSSPGP